MKKLISVTKGWKAIQEDYIQKDLRALHLQKLQAALRRDLSGDSFEEAVMHYTAIGFSALYTGVAGYIQSGTLENAEYYFYLASMATRTGLQLLLANPRREIRKGREAPLDYMLAAVLSGHAPAGIEILEAAPKTFDQEAPQPNRSRKDGQMDQRRKQRELLEIEFYGNLLQGKDGRASQVLEVLEPLHNDKARLQVMRAFLEQDGEGFSGALFRHMKEFRSTPYPLELNYFVLLMEALYLKRKDFTPLDLADAPAALLRLPEYRPERAEADTEKSLPLFDVGEIMKRLNSQKTGPKFQAC